MELRSCSTQRAQTQSMTSRPFYAALPHLPPRALVLGSKLSLHSFFCLCKQGPFLFPSSSHWVPCQPCLPSKWAPCLVHVNCRNTSLHTEAKAKQNRLILWEYFNSQPFKETDLRSDRSIDRSIDVTHILVSKLGYQKRVSDAPGAGVIVGCDLPCGFWELNPSPMEDQPMLITIETSLQLLRI